MSYAIKIGGNTIYFKMSVNGKVFFGKRDKVEGETIPHGATPISKDEWGEGSYGREGWANVMGSMGKVTERNTAELIIEDDIWCGLPNPDSPEFKKLIQTKGKVW